MRILIIDQCSGYKSVPEWFDPFDIEDLNKYSREELLDRDQVPSYPARDLYQGRQQQFITEAVDRLRDAGDTVDRVFISAGFGVVGENTHLPPYDVSFNDLSDTEIQARSTELGIQETILDKIETESAYDLIFFALGNGYYEALSLPRIVESISQSTFVVLFNKEQVADRYENVTSIPARNAEAKEQGTIVVGLKGRYLQNFAEHRQHGRTVDELDTVPDYCESGYTTQSGLDDYDSK